MGRKLTALKQTTQTLANQTLCILSLFQTAIIKLIKKYIKIRHTLECSGVKGGGQGAQGPPETFLREIFGSGKNEARKMVNNGKCRRKWGKMEKERRKMEKKKKKGGRKMRNVREKRTEKRLGSFCFSHLGNDWNFFGVYKMEISTGKRLKSRRGKIGKSDFAPPPLEKISLLRPECA